MQKFLLVLFMGSIFMACKNDEKPQDDNSEDMVHMPKEISKVVIQDIIVDSTLNVRALEVDKNREEVVFASSDGRIGVITKDISGGEDTVQSSFGFTYLNPHFGKNLLKDQNFRLLAFINNAIFVVNIGSPAKIYEISANDSVKLLYQEENEKAFYDSLDFWNENEGIAIGDPTDGCMSIIITRDAGETFKKLDCSKLPKAMDGEAAFAASDTNIAIIGDNTWVATGGMASRILYSPDKGETWEIYETPIVQGKETTGIYSIDFYDEKNGFAIGGDYTDPDSDISNKIRTTDGGKNWEVVADSTGPGYRSCVQYVPNGESNELVAIGFKGIDYSNDQGNSWKHLSDEGFYTIRFVNDSIAFAAGKGRISKLIFQ